MARTTIPISAISAQAQQQLKSSNVYDTPDNLPLSGNLDGELAYVSSTNRLYIWNGSGWYNIALINTSPSITGGYQAEYQFATDGTPIEITLVGSDPEGIPLTWSYEVTSGSLTNGGGTTATVSNVDNVFTITPSTNLDHSGAFSLTFKASDGINIATAISSFTLQFILLNSNHTTLLAKGTAATQNTTFIDSSTNNHTITANGDVYQGTFSPYREGGYSMYFDGNGDYLSVSMSAVMAFGAENMTIEGWVRPNTLSGIDTIYDTRVSYSTEGFSVYLEDGVVTVYAGSYSNAVPFIQAPSAINTLEWTHIAVTRTSGVNRLFLNGTSVASNSNSWNQTFNASAPYYIGKTVNNDTRPFDGYVSNFRLVKGTAVYTSNFTPPTEPLTAITNTSLLINTPYIADSSSNAHAITVNGNTSTQPFSPFDYKVYDEATNGGSAYFDGTGDYLIVGGDCSVGLSDFTIEAWVYPTGYNTWHSIFSTRPTGSTAGSTDVWALGYNADGHAYLYSGAMQVEGTAGLLKTNSWNHVAVSRESGTMRLFVNGVLDVSASSNENYTNISATIGANNNGDEPCIGYLSDVRLIKGTALYTSSFDLLSAPMNAITNTEVLVSMTNAGIQDYSQVNDLKLLGNVTGSNTQIKNSNYSISLDGSSSGILLPYSNALHLSGDFTIELWFYAQAYGGMILNHGGGLNIAWASYELVNNADGINFAASSANTSYDIGSETGTTGRIGTIALNTWNHIVVTREGNVYRGFVNGVQGYTQTLSLTPYDTASRGLAIGHNYGGTWGGTPESSISGYIEDLRITKGLARYTANFTPSTLELLG